MNDGSPDPAAVLGAYLDDMLRPATGDTALRPRAPRSAPVLLPETLLAPDEIEPAAGEVLPAAADPRDAARPAARERNAGDGAEQGADSAGGDDAPAAPADYRFPLQCLLFRIGPHLLAMPLTRLGSVHKRGRSPTRLPGSPAWLLGMLDLRGVRTRVADSLHLLTDGAQTDAEFEHLLVLDDGRWAITCGQVEQVVELQRDDVKWGPRNLRLGTIRRSLAGLLDPGAIVERLESDRRPLADDENSGRRG